MKAWYGDSLSYHLLRAARVHRSRAAALLSEIGLHPGQETVLQILSEQDGRTMSDLSTVLAVQPPTVTKMVSRMSQQDLVERRTSRTDGRLMHVYLTETGRNRAKDVKRIWKQLEKEATASLSEKDGKKLVKLLGSIADDLSPGKDTHKGVKPGDVNEPVDA
ncbi:MAG: MarR family winged helix-turn-helix transcriptional regulator [Pseudomonadota bacterium]